MSRSNDSRRAADLAFYGVVLLIAYLAYQIVQPFLVEIAWALVVAICLAPAQRRLERRIGSLRAALVLTLLALLLVFVPAILTVGALVREGSSVVEYVQRQLNDRGGPMGLFHLLWDWLRQRLPMLPDEELVVGRVSSGLAAFANQLAGRAGSVVKGVLSIVFSLLITLGILFFVLKDVRTLEAVAPRLLPFGRVQNERLLSLTRDIVSASVTSMLAVAIIQGLIGGVTFVLLGIPGAALWSGLMTVLALLPAVGATLVWAPAAIWLAVSGSLVKGIVLALVGLLVLSNVDNVVRPLLLSGSARMNTLVLIMSLLGGVSAFGFIGVVLGPVVAAIVTALFESYLPPHEPSAASPPGASPDAVGASPEGPGKAPEAPAPAGPAPQA